MGCLLTPVSLLQVYFVLTFQTSQGLHLCQAEFVQFPISTRLISTLNYKFFPPTHTERLREHYHEAGGGRLFQPGTISWGQLGLIRDSLNAQGIGQGNIPIVSDYVVDTYACGRHGTRPLRGRGRIGFTGPWCIVRGFWSCYQWQN